MKDYITVIVDADSEASQIDMAEIKKYVEELIGEEKKIFIDDNTDTNPFIFDEQKTGVYIFISRNKLPDQYFYAKRTRTNTSNYNTASMQYGTLYYYRDIDQAEDNEYVAMFIDQSTLRMTAIRKSTGASGISATSFGTTFVNTITQQDITGRKTFTDPRVRNDYTMDNDFKLTHKKYVDDKVDAIKTIEGRTFNYEDANNDYFIFEDEEPGIIFLTLFNHQSPYGQFKWKYLKTSSGSGLTVPAGCPIYYIKKYTECVTGEIFCYFYQSFSNKFYCLKKTATGGQSQEIEDHWVNVSNKQTIYGEKTFNALPKTTIVPTADEQLTNKKYVDDEIAKLKAELGGS